MAKQINASDFENEVVSSQIPVLVDFWAEWCGPCRALAPILEEAAQQFEGKIKVCKMNVDENKELSKSFGIMSIPTLIIFKDGKPVDKSLGLIPLDELAAFIEKNL